MVRVAAAQTPEFREEIDSALAYATEACTRAEAAGASLIRGFGRIRLLCAHIAGRNPFATLIVVNVGIVVGHHHSLNRTRLQALVKSSDFVPE
jgi:hypothetical protein